MDFQKDKIDNRKKELIATLTMANGPYYSSAVNLDNDLRRNGFRMARHFARSYNLPGNITPAEYENHFYQTYELSLRLMQKTLRPLNNPTKDSLDEAVKENISKEFPYTNMLLKKEFSNLQKLNPELRELQPTSFAELCNTVRGVIYQFDIPELKFFLSANAADKNKANAYNIAFKNQNNIAINYMLALESRKDLDVATQKRNSQQQEIESQKRYMHFLESRGFYDD